MDKRPSHNVWHHLSRLFFWFLSLLTGLFYARTSGLFALGQAYTLEGKATAVVVSGEEAFFLANGQCKLLYTFTVGEEPYVGPSFGGIDFPRRCPSPGSTIEVVYDPTFPAANMWAPSYTHWIGIAIAFLVALLPLFFLVRRSLAPRLLLKKTPVTPHDLSVVSHEAFSPVPIPALMTFLEKVPRLEHEYGDLSSAQLWELFDDSGVGTLHLSNAYESARLFTLRGILEGEFGHGPQDYGSDPDYVSFDLLPHPSLGCPDETTSAEYRTYMEELFQTLSATYGTPYANICAGETSFFWWAIEEVPGGASRMCLRLARGATNEIACLWGTRETTTEHALNAETAKQLIARWADVSWPLSPTDFTRLASESGWMRDPRSPRRYFLPLIPDEARAAKKRTVSRNSVPSFPASVVTVMRGLTTPSEAGDGESIRGVRFSLAGYTDLIGQASWWPQIGQLTTQISQQLTLAFGSPTITEGTRGSSSSWILPSGGCLTLESGAGQAWVTVHASDCSVDEVRESRYLFSVDDALLVIDQWLTAKRPLSHDQASAVLKKVGWRTRYDTAYSTPVSSAGQDGAMLYGHDSHMGALSFNLAADSHREAHTLTAQRIESRMKDLERALTERYGSPTAHTYAGAQYRRWFTGAGTIIRIAYGKGINAVWVYDEDQRHRVDRVFFPAFPHANSLAGLDVMHAEQLPWDFRVESENTFSISTAGEFLLLVIIPWIVTMTLGSFVVRWFAF